MVERAVQILPHIKLCIEAVESKQPRIGYQTTKSYGVVRDCCNDCLLTEKLNLYQSLATELRTFLTSYQTDKSMLPFLSDDLFKIIKALMLRFMKVDSLKDVTTAQKLVAVDPTDKKMHVHYKKVEIGFSS